MLLTRYIACIIITQGYYGTLLGYFSIFKKLILTQKLTLSANYFQLGEVKCISDSDSDAFIWSYCRPRRPLIRPNLVAVAEATWKKIKYTVSVLARFSPPGRNRAADILSARAAEIPFCPSFSPMGRNCSVIHVYRMI